MPNGPPKSVVLAFEPPSPFLESLVARFPEFTFSVRSRSECGDWLKGADVLFAWQLSATDLEFADCLQWVQWAGAGVDDAPLGVLERRQIVLTNNRGVHAVNIAEHVLAMMLAFYRALPFLFEAQSRRVWRDDEGRARVRELSGSNLLVLGAGMIGSALAQKAEALGVLVTTIGRQPRATPRQVHGLDELDALLPYADHVAICLPLTAGTRGLFDRERFGRMKPGAIIYNIGRGPIIDTVALIDALQSGRLSGAGLDVTDPEPPPSDHPLWRTPNVMITAHTAGATPHYWARALDIFSDNLQRFRDDAELRNLVQFDRGY